MQEYNKRDYSRASHFGCDVRVSTDKMRWQNADVTDISSGGLKLMTETEYAAGTELWFDLRINGFMSEFTVQVKGIVRHQAPYRGKYQYGIQFVGLSPDLKIRIDENVHNDRPVGRGVYSND